jgi:hypothetical protein
MSIDTVDAASGQNWPHILRLRLLAFGPPPTMNAREALA